jgi:sugar lactone lactonase YvrE
MKNPGVCQTLRSEFIIAALAIIHCGIAISGEVTVIHSSDHLWTGLAMDSEGTTLVCFPDWGLDSPLDVAELSGDGMDPWPDSSWNSWDGELPPGNSFVSVQSVYYDSDGLFWILDTGNPGMSGIVEGGARLLSFDASTDTLVAAYDIPLGVLAPSSYPNDVRIDHGRDVAYITDSGDGAILVLDLDSGTARRLLDHHPSTEAEEMAISPGGTDWVGPDGFSPRIEADGIALSPDGSHLYYHALTGRSLYRIPADILCDASASEEQVAGAVEFVCDTGPCDGMIFGPEGTLYVTLLDFSGVGAVDPVTGEMEIVVSDPEIRWPDSFTLDPPGRICFTTSQIHLLPDPGQQYRVYRLE